MLSTIEEGEIILTEVTGLIIELGVDQEMIMKIEGMTGLIIDKATKEKISDKMLMSKDRARSISQDQDRSRQQFRDISRGRNQYSRDQSRDRRQWSRTVSRDRGDRPESVSRSRSGSRVSTNRDRLRCFRCSEYDHFARECPNTMTEDDSD